MHPEQRLKCLSLNHNPIGFEEILDIHTLKTSQHAMAPDCRHAFKQLWRSFLGRAGDEEAAAIRAANSVVCHDRFEPAVSNASNALGQADLVVENDQLSLVVAIAQGGPDCSSIDLLRQFGGEIPRMRSKGDTTTFSGRRLLVTCTSSSGSFLRDNLPVAAMDVPSPFRACRALSGRVAFIDDCSVEDVASQWDVEKLGVIEGVARRLEFGKSV